MCNFWVKWFLAVICLGTARAFPTLYDAGNQTTTIPGTYLGNEVDYMPVYTGESRFFYATYLPYLTYLVAYPSSPYSQPCDRSEDADGAIPCFVRAFDGVGGSDGVY